MKVLFETEEELTAFLRGAKVSGDKLGAFGAIEFATQELAQFEFLRNDLMLRFESMAMALIDTFERMKAAEKKHAKDFGLQQNDPVISKNIAEVKRIGAKSKRQAKTQ